MNTEITREQFITFRNAFRALAHAKQLTKEDMMLYNIVRGLPASRGFTSITSEVKLRNGMIADHSLCMARINLKWNLTRKLDMINAKFGNFLGTLPTVVGISECQILEQRSSVAAHLYAVIS